MKVKNYQNNLLNNLPNETWVDVFGFEDYYAVSSLGRVRGKDRMSRCGRRKIKEKILKPWKSKTGSYYLQLNEKTMVVSNIVVSSFLRKDISQIVLDKKTCIHHKDFDSSNNAIDNLEIQSFKYIMKKAFLSGITNPKIGLFFANQSNKPKNKIGKKLSQETKDKISSSLKKYRLNLKYEV